MKGFTLIELMIVVAIIAILISIAIPVYDKKLAENTNDNEPIEKEYNSK